MSEIEKMYENAGVELVADVKFPTTDVNYNVSFPPFTAEKQIELIKWLAKKDCMYRLTYERDFLWWIQPTTQGPKKVRIFVIQ